MDGMEQGEMKELGGNAAAELNGVTGEFFCSEAISALHS